MSLSKIKKLNSLPTNRVKCIDFHPSKPLLLCALYSGEALVVDSLRGSIIKTFPRNTFGYPLRACRWIPKTEDFVTGGDNRSLNFYSHTKGKQTLEIQNAHEGNIRSIAVHPTEQLMLSCADDLTVKLWDISSGCTLIRSYEGHGGLVMDVKWNPKDTTTFVSCSLDGTAIFWDISSDQPRFTQKISTKCINSVAFCSQGDRSLLAAGSDDHDIRIIDLQTRSVIATLSAHSHNVTRVDFHPARPILVSTGEDNLTVIWSTITWKKENSLSSQFERGWALAFSNTLPLMAIGHDKGLSIHRFKNLGTPMSLDPTGKLVKATGTEIQVAALKNIPEFVDGSDLQIQFKDGCVVETPPSSIIHSPNGRYLAVTGEGEWSILTSLGFRSRAYGKGIMFGWASNSTAFATLNINRTVDVHSNFDDAQELPIFAMKLWGGELIGASVSDGLNFYDWESLQLVRRIEIKPSEVKWSGDLVAVRSKTSIAILAYNPDHGEDTFEEGAGFSDSFDLIYEIEAKASSIAWAGGILLYTEGNKVNRIAGGIVLPTSSMKSPVDIIGYLPREGTIILADQQRSLLGVNLPNALLEFEESVVMHGEEEEDDDESIDTSIIPENYRARTAKFLKQIGKLKLALEVSNDSAMKFDLALELGDLETAAENATDSSMWRRLARLALTSGKIEIAEKALKNCLDFSTLLLLLKARNKTDAIKELCDEAEKAGQLNVAFSAAYITGQHERCTKLLLASNKYAEASYFARSHCPSLTSECVKEWKKHIQNERMADAIADPEEFPDLFDELVVNNDNE